MIKIEKNFITINEIKYDCYKLEKLERKFHYSYIDQLTGLEDIKIIWLDNNLVKMSYQAEVPTDDIEIAL